MKKVIHLSLTLVFLFIYGCNTEQLEQSDLSVNSEQIDLRTPVSVYNFDKDGNPVEVKKISLADFTHFRASKGPNSQSINGHFTNQLGMTNTISAMQNPGGTHGNILNSGDFGTIKLDVLCVWNEGNVGMAGGIISENNYDVVDGFPFGPGDSIYFVFQDNGEGLKADADQYVQGIFFLPFEAWGDTEPFGLCEFLPPPSFWDTFFTTPELCGCPEPSGLKDVLNRGDQIQVK